MSRRLAAALTVVLFAGCGAPLLPDPDASQTIADVEEVVRAVIEDQTAPGGADWACAATLWGRDGPALLAEVECHSDHPDGTEQGFATPVRAEGRDVTYPQDGAGFADSLRRMWGRSLAEAYLDQ